MRTIPCGRGYNNSYPSGNGRNSEPSHTRRNGGSGNVTNSNDCSEIKRDRNFYCERFRNNNLKFIADILQSQDDFTLCMDYSRQVDQCEQEIKANCMLTDRKEIAAKVMAVVSEGYADYQILHPFECMEHAKNQGYINPFYVPYAPHQGIIVQDTLGNYYKMKHNHVNHGLPGIYFERLN